MVYRPTSSPPPPTPQLQHRNLPCQCRPIHGVLTTYCTPEVIALNVSLPISEHQEPSHTTRPKDELFRHHRQISNLPLSSIRSNKVFYVGQGPHQDREYSFQCPGYNVMSSISYKGTAYIYSYSYMTNWL